MIRWYDYLAAILVADFLMANFLLALTGPTFFIQLFGSFGVALLYDVWVNVYCIFRLKMETKDGE